jgi:LysR family transcriptional regulator, glycine cleavage system transcriptional activator
MRVLSISRLKAFQLAGMTGSFKHAAHLLSISPSAVSARVRSLERDLGVRLFRRGMRRLTLTEAGADYVREVEATFVSFDMATRDLRTKFGQPTRGHPESPKRRAGAVSAREQTGNPGTGSR